MSLPPDRSNDDRTPFDAGDSAASQPSDPLVQPKRKITPAWLKVFWNEMPRANQLAVAAAGGALAVVLTAGALSFLMAPGIARLNAKYSPVAAQSPTQTEIREAKPVGQSPQSPIVQTEVMLPPAGDTLSETTMEPLTAEDEQKLQMRRREEQIIKEKRLLEDKKRAIEQQIADKQLEEQRAAEDKKRWEEQQAQDKQRMEQRQQEAKQKLEEEQRQLDEEQRKLAEAG